MGRCWADVGPGPATTCRGGDIQSRRASPASTSSINGDSMADDEAGNYDGFRSQFPVAFGKQSKPLIPLEAIHNATARRPSTAGTTTTDRQENTNQGLPSLSSSSKAWLTSLRNAKSTSTSRHHDDGTRTNPSSSSADDDIAVGPPRPPPDDDDDDDGDVMIGPPRPPPDDDDDDGGVMIGPPRPPPVASNSDDDEDGDDAMIGPPRPPPAEMDADGDDDGSVMIGPPRPPPTDSDSDDDLAEQEENRYRIPLSNEIVLKGHSKVTSFAS